MAGFDKLVIIMRKTGLEELIERFNTRDQARFYIEQMGETSRATRLHTTPMAARSTCSRRRSPQA